MDTHSITGELTVIPAGTGQPTQTRAVAAEPTQQQVPQQAPISTGSGETLILILCVAIAITAWRKSKAVRWPIAASLIAGVLLAGSIVGPMIKQTSGQAGTQMENMVNGVQNGGATGGNR